MWGLKNHTYLQLLLFFKTKKQSLDEIFKNASLCYKRSKMYINMHILRAVKIPK